MTFRPEIYTREGKVQLKSLAEQRGLGVTREERILTVIDRYAQAQPVELREPVKDMYVRAYRKAGLLAGDPDAITTALPKIASGAESGSADPKTTQPPGDTRDATTVAQRESGGEPAATDDNPTEE